MTTVSLRQAWVALVAGVLLLALVPAGLALDRRLASELEEQARADLAMAPKILADRQSSRSDALMMRARELSSSASLVAAVAEDRRGRAVELLRSTLAGTGLEPLLVGGGGEAWVGPPVPGAAVEAARRGEAPVALGEHGGRIYRLSLAPLVREGRWIGAAGVASPLGTTAAGELAGLTRAEVALVDAGGRVTASTREEPLPPAVRDSTAAWAGDGRVHEVTGRDGRRYWAAVAPLGEAGAAVFLREVGEALGVLPDLRRSGLVAVLIALGLALLVGGLLAARMARPVGALARASERLADGDFEAPLPDSRIRELEQVSRAFGEMRRSLREKVRQLTEANRELEERQRRLQSLQSELIQRDRLAATGRIITELAHEIRNPVASVRNCLEIIDRRLDEEDGLREYAGMAIDELLRMHRLAEQMLDANRPVDPDAGSCRPVARAREVAELAGAAGREAAVDVRVEGPGELEAAIAPDALKQVLLNLVENAREAMAAAADEAGGEGTVEIRVAREEASGAGEALVRVEVLDRGPGLAEGTEDRIFDAFFTTKEEVHGVGLGLFVAQGLVRRHGGEIRASNREGGGARFVLRLPAAGPGHEGATREGGRAP